MPAENGQVFGKCYWAYGKVRQPCHAGKTLLLNYMYKTLSLYITLNLPFRPHSFSRNQHQIICAFIAFGVVSHS